MTEVSDEILWFVPNLKSRTGESYFNYLGQHWDQSCGIMKPSAKEKRKQNKIERQPLGNWEQKFNKEELKKFCVINLPKSDLSGSYYFEKLNENWSAISRESMFQTRSAYLNGKQLELKDIVREGYRARKFDASVTPWIRTEGGLGPSIDNYVPVTLDLDKQETKIFKLAKHIAKKNRRLDLKMLEKHLHRYILLMRLSAIKLRDLLGGKSAVGENLSISCKYLKMYYVFIVNFMFL